MTDSPAPIAALVLAAGGASRMGRTKPLLDWGGKSLVRHIVDVANASGVDATLVVCGPDREAVSRALEGTGALCLPHPGWREGLGSSIAAGIRALLRIEDERDRAWDAVLLLLCDQPFVSPELLRSLLRLRQNEGRPRIACRYGGSIGPPALFERADFGALAGLDGDRGAKALLQKEPGRVSLIDFPEGEHDLDTLSDYANALSAQRDE